ncbi:hypothetical protein IGI04_033190 [Brassica rapa subsp. trilocularis]|uniref:TFIIB-type domain-containing protein n=1 Tax=Brassica rapa subsp. trilocularis TaxID=1813537 RepID=A0ABQ7L569_BRACM|nr:hypothetical protein IGI04_033190 [Brassica rapa subsp. trilocularis]
METCLDCKKATETVIDLRTGDTICTECSLVISDHYIDDCQEWRTFANDDNSDQDPNRVGAPTNPLLKSGGIGTIIKENTFSSVSKNDLLGLSRAHNLVRNKEEDLFKKACDAIKRMTEDLDLISGVEFRACEIVSKFDVDSRKKLRRGKQLTALCAASVSTACRELKLSRTLKEISTVASGVSLKDINKASMAIKRLLRSDQEEAVSDAAPQVIMKTGELVRRFCSKLDISERERKAIREAVEIAENFDIRRNPKSVLAAIIFMICQLSQTKRRPIAEIALTSEVVENTIKKSANDMYPYASKIIPKWYASEEDIIKSLGGGLIGT